MKRLRTPITARYILNHKAARPNTYNQQGNELSHLPYFIVDHTKRPDIRKRSPYMVESFKDDKRSFFAGLMPIKKNLYVSDFGRSLYAFRKDGDTITVFVWLNYLPRTIRQRKKIVLEFLKRKNPPQRPVRG